MGFRLPVNSPWACLQVGIICSGDRPRKHAIHPAGRRNTLYFSKDKVYQGKAAGSHDHRQAQLFPISQ
jgi:hypothetical protein